MCDLETHEQAIAVDQACGSEVGLRFAVEALLSADRVDGDPLSDRAIDEQQDQTVPAVIDGFRIIRELGRGGMGVVYEAEQDSPCRRVALKLIRPERSSRILRSRLRREAEVLGMLQHPGIAQIYKTGVFEGRHYIAMELIDGESLLDATQSMPLIDRVNLLIRIIDAVHYAHQKGVIHRDLKPENVLVTGPSPSDERHPKIVDFGIARATEDSNRATLAASLTIGGGGSLIGTLAYMAPEQLEGGGDADVRSDVYALGMIAYALLTGSQAVDVRGLPVAAAVRAVLEAEPKRAGAVNPRLRGDVETIIHKSIHPDRERRYQSAFEFSA
ncbi:MAG: serine/threonine-protein kinase, partial [Phycisphaerales bacterium]